MKNANVIRAAKDCARAPYAWPGGYPKFLVMHDGGALCPKCVLAEFALIGRSTRDNALDGWDAAGVDINWEDTELTCDHCGDVIPSAYGEEA